LGRNHFHRAGQATPHRSSPSGLRLEGQPFVTDAFLVPRTHIGITLDDPSQINFISAKQVEYRLAQPNGAPRAEEHQIVPSPGGFRGASNGPMPLQNHQIVEQMLATAIARQSPRLSRGVL
jgi:hypothetical protein